MDCIFCKIANKQIGSTIVYENNDILVFKDINPVAKIHFLIIPKKHIDSMNTTTNQDQEIIGKIVIIAAKIAKEYNIDSSGYRLLANCNRDAGMEVNHLHFHLLGGERLAPIGK